MTIYYLDTLAAASYRATCGVLRTLGIRLVPLPHGGLPPQKYYLLVPSMGVQRQRHTAVPNGAAAFENQLASLARNNYPVANAFVCLDHQAPRYPDHHRVFRNLGITIANNLAGLILGLSYLPKSLGAHAICSITEPAILNDVRYLLHQLRGAPRDADLRAARECLQKLSSRGTLDFANAGKDDLCALDDFSPQTLIDYLAAYLRQRETKGPSR